MTWFLMMWYWKPQDKKQKKRNLLFNGTTRNSTSTKGTRHLTHYKLPGNAIWSLLVPSLLSLQLGQEAPQYPGLMLHGWLYSTLPGIGHLSQACQDTKVLVHGSWIATTWCWGRWHFCSCYTEHFSIATVTSRNYCEGERVNCLRGSKSKLTGSAVRWILLPRPLGVSHWVLKSPGCLIARAPAREWGGKHPQIERDTHFMHVNWHKQLFLPKVRVAVQAVEPVGQHSGPMRGVEEGCG